MAEIPHLIVSDAIDHLVHEALARNIADNRVGVVAQLAAPDQGRLAGDDVLRAPRWPAAQYDIVPAHCALLQSAAQSRTR